MSLKVYISTGGDHSVGIQPGTAAIEFSYNPLEEMERAELREILQNCFRDIMDDGTGMGLRFSDECVDCGQIHEEGKPCPNRQCPSKAPGEETDTD